MSLMQREAAIRPPLNSAVWNFVSKGPAIAVLSFSDVHTHRAATGSGRKTTFMLKNGSRIVRRELVFPATNLAALVAACFSHKK